MGELLETWKTWSCKISIWLYNTCFTVFKNKMNLGPSLEYVVCEVKSQQSDSLNDPLWTTKQHWWCILSWAAWSFSDDITSAPVMWEECAGVVQPSSSPEEQLSKLRSPRTTSKATRSSSTFSPSGDWEEDWRNSAPHWSNRSSCSQRTEASPDDEVQRADSWRTKTKWANDYNDTSNVPLNTNHQL